LGQATYQIIRLEGLCYSLITSVRPPFRSHILEMALVGKFWLVIRHWLLAVTDLASAMMADARWVTLEGLGGIHKKPASWTLGNRLMESPLLGQFP
jgi:hypothetical protein